MVCRRILRSFQISLTVGGGAEAIPEDARRQFERVLLIAGESGDGKDPSLDSREPPERMRLGGRLAAAPRPGNRYSAPTPLLRRCNAQAGNGLPRKKIAVARLDRALTGQTAPGSGRLFDGGYFGDALELAGLVSV
jgi:hypothetical protein